jgi:hypothetical protein
MFCQIVILNIFQIALHNQPELCVANYKSALAKVKNNYSAVKKAG